MGMTPQHFHTIPTSCAILPPLTQICFVFVTLGWGELHVYIFTVYALCTHLNDLWTDRRYVWITVSKRGTCLWDGRACATRCEKDGKVHVERVEVSEVQTPHWTWGYGRFLIQPFFASLGATLAYLSISPWTLWGSGYNLGPCLRFRFLHQFLSSFFLALISFLPSWCRDNETASAATA